MTFDKEDIDYEEWKEATENGKYPSRYSSRPSIAFSTKNAIVQSQNIPIRKLGDNEYE